MSLKQKIKKVIKGDIQNSPAVLDQYSRDASLFEVKPQLIISPKNSKDLQNLVKFVNQYNKNSKTLNLKPKTLSLTARAAGTGMDGGALTGSIVVDFLRYFNQIKSVTPRSKTAVTQPGVYYRDFEKATLKHKLLLPSYPASKEIAAIGGLISNNSGGEKTLTYGKTQDYVQQLKMILSDGHEHTIKPLSKKELDKKLSLKNFEGDIYNKIHKLVTHNTKIIKKAKPDVSKNSSGYNLWDVWDGQTFDLTKLFVGSQGTLGLVTEAKIRLITPKIHSKLLIITLRDLKPLARLINQVLKHKPESFESFDDNTLKLGMRFLFWKYGLQFLPEIGLIIKNGFQFPKLVLIAEFTGDSPEDALKKAQTSQASIAQFKLPNRITTTDRDTEKYWAVRRDSFNFLRHKIKNKKTAPFIDDIIVAPKYLSEFLPQLDKILKPHPITYTIAGHIGDGNFHIIPLMDLANDQQRALIPQLSQKVYDLVFKYHGSMSGEHNDGLIRGPYLKKMFGSQYYKLMEEVKKILDPNDIFNPGKKISGNLKYSLNHIKKS